MFSSLICSLMQNSRVLILRQAIGQKLVFKVQSHVNSVCWGGGLSMDLTVNRSQPHVVLSRGIRTGLSQLSHEVWRLTWPPWEGGWCWTGPVRIYLRYEIPSDNQLCCYLLAGCSFTLSVCKFLFIPQMSLPL